MNQSTPKNHSSVKITCTDTIQKNGVEMYVLESAGQYDGLNKVWVYTEREYSFPIEKMKRNIQSYIDSAPLYCQDFTLVTEWDTANNLVEVFVTSTGGHSRGKPVKILSERFLK